MRTFALAAISLLVLPCAVPTRAGAAIPETVLRGSWSEVRSRHGRVLSDAGAERAAHLAEVLERLHEQAGRTARSLAIEPGHPRTTVAFATRDAFQAYLPTYGGRPEEDSGLFQPTPECDFLLLQPGPAAEVDRVALHEYTHALLRESVPTAPPWLNEGLAQYFSTLRVNDADARVGEPVPEALDWLKTHDLMPVSELLAVGYGSDDYHGGAKRGTFYAESWLLVHMLLNENVQDLPRFESFLAALRRGDDARAAFRATYGEEQRMFWRLEVYVHRPSFSAMNWNFSQPFASLTTATRGRVPNVEVVSALGTMLLWRRGGDPEAAAAHLRAATGLAADDPATRAFAAAVSTRKALGSEAQAATDGPGAAEVGVATEEGAGVPSTISAGVDPTGVGLPVTAEELALITPLLHAQRPRQARLYLGELLARDLRPGQRRCIERLMRLLEPSSAPR